LKAGGIYLGGPALSIDSAETTGARPPALNGNCNKVDGAAVEARRLMGVNASTDPADRRLLFRSSSVVGRQPRRRQVSATDVAAAGTYRNESSRME
jgi:hypothetical protein